MRRLLRAVVGSVVWVSGVCVGVAGGMQPVAPAAAAKQEAYCPPRGAWERKKPSEVGMDDRLVLEAVEWAKGQATDWPRDFSKQEEIFGKPLGPVATTRAEMNGVIVRRGYIVAEFGDVEAVDPTYSVAKSYLATIAGVAVDRGLIGDVNELVGQRVKDGGYDSEHNARVTWAHHLTQTSEWEGEMFGKPSTFIGREAFGSAEMKPRAIRDPGTHYEYNDVRVNRLALSLLRVLERPLPEVLKTEIMEPIGASGTWQYLAYDNAAVQVDGKEMRSVSGGTRWGGGLWISTMDQARFGLLMQRGGEWDGKQIVSREWIAEATSQQGVKKGYGYLWWLNSEGTWKDVPRESFAAQGAGSNTVWVDPAHELVVVWRWHRDAARGEFLKRVVAAVKTE